VKASLHRSPYSENAHCLAGVQRRQYVSTTEEQRRNRRSQAGTFKIPPAKRHEIQTKKSPFAARTFENQSIPIRKID